MVGHFSNFDVCRSEAADDVISGLVLGSVGVDVHKRFGYATLNRLFDSLAGRTRNELKKQNAVHFKTINISDNGLAVVEKKF